MIYNKTGNLNHRISFRTDNETYKRLTREAKASGVSVSLQINRFLNPTFWRDAHAETPPFGERVLVCTCGGDVLIDEVEWLDDLGVPHTPEQEVYFWAPIPNAPESKPYKTPVNVTIEV